MFQFQLKNARASMEGLASNQDRPEKIRFPVRIDGIWKLPAIEHVVEILTMNTGFGHDLKGLSKFAVPVGLEAELNKTIPNLGKIISGSIPAIRSLIKKCMASLKSNGDEDTSMYKRLNSAKDEDIIASFKGVEKIMIGDYEGKAYTFIWLDEDRKDNALFNGFNGVALVLQAGHVVEANYGDSGKFPAW